MHAWAEAHDTADNCPLGGATVGWTIHLPELHRSASVVTGEPTNVDPTATHTPEDGHDTPEKKLLATGLSGLGVG
jgi:hypothetical protein